jgi:hypothetical protein
VRCDWVLKQRPESEANLGLHRVGVCSASAAA